MIKQLLAILFPPAASGFGSAGISRQRESGAILIVGDWDGQRGVETDETGISISRIETRYFPYVNDRLMSNVAEPRARAVSDKLSREVTIEGEVTGADGLMAANVGEAISVANDVDTFGDGSGDLLFDEATETQSRGDWRAVSIKLSSDPGITVS